MLNLNLPKVIAHRGASAYAPENTLSAFAKAYRLGASWVEFDVMLSQCGKPVIIHDETLDRTTNGHGLVSDHTYAEIVKLDAGSWFDKKFVGETIPSLAETLLFLQQQHMHANVEIKATPFQTNLAIEKILSVIEKNWDKSLPPLLISTFSLPLLKQIRAYSQQATLGLLMDTWLKNWLDIVNELSCISVHVNQNLLTPERVKMVKAQNKYLLCYTVNDPVRAQELFSWGVDSVFSDCADKILALFPKK